MTPLLPVLPGPLFLFVAALAVALLSYLLHRWTALSALVAAAGCLALSWIALGQLTASPPTLMGHYLALADSWVLLGRGWAFTPSSLAALTFIFGIAGLTFLLSIPASQGWSFSAFGMAVLAVLSLVVTAQHYVYALLFLWLAACLAAFVLAGGYPGQTTGALRFLVLSTLAVIPLLVLPAYLDPGSVQVAPATYNLPPPPDRGANAASVLADQTASVLADQTASVLATIGFSILLMAVPFHGQIVAIAAHSAPMVPSFALSVFSPVVLHILLRLGQTYPGLLADRLLFDICQWTGIAAVVVGGLAAMGQRQWGTLVGYGILVDWGAGLIALGQGTAHGIEHATSMVIWRAFSLLLVGAGWTVAFGAVGRKGDIDRCAGLVSRRPLSVAAMVVGLLSLAAFPLTPGAAGRWPLVLDLMATEPASAWTLVLASAAVGIGTIAALWSCLKAPQTQAGERRLRVGLDTVLGLLAVWLVGYLFLHPSPWLGVAQQFLSEFSFLAH